MKTRIGLLAFFLCLFTYIQAQGSYPKVILKGDYPDPSILRDGEDYYMTHSPFYYSPGFLIWHSKDLINWEPVCRTLYGHTGSAMAPDLVKYNNRFYIYYPAAGSNWVIWADNIRGPWSKPVDLHVGYIDPGHSVGEDGKRYLHLSEGNVVPLSDDGLSVIGKIKKIYNGWDYPTTWITEGKFLESPKIVKKGEYYYMTTAEGGTAGPATSHMVVSARSKSISGPWENSPYNPIVHTYSADDRWWSKGHGTIIDDVNGNWWIVYHSYENGAYPLGRQTLLQPIKWTNDGWFYAEEQAKPIQPKGEPVKHGMVLSDNFKEKSLGLQWTTWQNFDANNVFLKNGALYMKGKGSIPKDAQLLLTTATDKNYGIQVEVTVGKGAIGGLLLFYSEKAFAGISSDGKQFTIYENAGKQVTKPNTLGNHFFLKIVNTKNSCDIQVSKNKKTWETLSNGLDVSEMHHNKYKGFFALRPGLLAAGNGTVKFNDFVYEPQQVYRNTVTDKVSLPERLKHDSVVRIPLDLVDDLIFDQKATEREAKKQASKEGVIAPKPVFRDPVYDGAADPVVVWNPLVKRWWMYYTNRRATMTELPGVSWVFGTPIGIAESEDGANWKYLGIANFPDLPAECGGKDATLWAPDIVPGDDGKWHMYLSAVPGIATKWGLPGFIAHLTSTNMRDWKYEKRLTQLGTKVIDSDILKMPDGTWRMYYKDQTKYSHINMTESKDLYNWSDPKEAMRIMGEGPIAFQWKGYYWLIIDTWNGQTVHRSLDGGNWIVQPGGTLLPDDEGIGKDDIPNGLHANVVISNDRVYMYYFTHPGRTGNDKQKDTFEQRRTSIQVVELELNDAGWIMANRNKPTFVNMNQP